jgi:hypothetical protein
MAAFFKTPISAVIALRPAATVAPLACRWTRDAMGRPIRAWDTDPGGSPHEVREPAPFAIAA